MALPVFLVLISIAVVSSQITNEVVPVPCTVGQGSDALVGQTQLLGNKNASDSIWHDQVWAFRKWGPISKVTMYKAHFYDGLWHDPGELKGFQFWYGPTVQPPIYKWEDGDSNLMGARKPHIPQEWALQPGEVIVKVELQWDPISMRHATLTTSTGRELSWGFKDVSGCTTATASAPVPGAYLAAFRGFEGRPRPVAKKRYLIQLAFVWAVPSCQAAGAPPAPPAIPAPNSGSRSAAARAATSLYSLPDSDLVALIPQGVEASNILWDSTTVQLPPPDAVFITPPGADSQQQQPPREPTGVDKESAAATAAASAPAPVPAPPGTSGSPTPPPVTGSVWQRLWSTLLG